jgi:hypothetical protein
VDPIGENGTEGKGVVVLADKGAEVFAVLIITSEQVFQ